MNSRKYSLLSKIFANRNTRSYRRRHAAKRRRFSMVQPLESRSLLTAVVETGVDDRQITGVGNIDAATGLVDHASAYNALTGETLVVFSAENANDEETVVGEREIYGQIVAPQGFAREQFRISEAGGLGNTEARTQSPDVVWNSEMNQFLVTWVSSDANLGDDVSIPLEVRGQLVSGDGSPFGPDDFRIGDVGGLTNETRYVFAPAVTHNPHTNEFFVVWHADDPAAGLASFDREIFGQRVDRDGFEIGEDDFQISNASGSESGDPRSSYRPDVSANTTTGEYLVTWHSRSVDGDDNPDGSTQVFGQLLDADGSAIGSDDFQISRHVGYQGESSAPATVYNRQMNEYFVTWQADDTSRLGDRGTEIFAQRVSATGDNVLEESVLVSSTSSHPTTFTRSIAPSVAWNSQSSEYLVAWHADDVQIGVLSGHEVFAQRIDQVGSRVGHDDFRVSHPDHENPELQTRNADVIWNSQRNEYLVMWSSNITEGDSNRELIGQVLEVQEAIPIDFSNVFNMDVIANRPEGTNDPTQATLQGEVLITASFAEANADDDPDGLPDDGFFPAYRSHPAVQLGYRNDDNGRNAVGLLNHDASVSVDAPGSYFDSVYVYAFSQNGLSEFELEVTYGNGTTSTQTVRAADWLFSPADKDDFYRVARDLDTYGDDGVVDRNRAGFSGFRFNTNENLEVAGLRITKVSDTGELYVLGASGIGHTAETLVVNSIADSVDGDMDEHDLTLREALHRVARSTATADTVVFADSLKGQKMDLWNGVLKVFGSANIVGPGADQLTLDGMTHFQVLDFPLGNRDNVISGLTLARGDNNLGGAIRSNGRLTLDSVAIRDSEAGYGGAIYASSQSELNIIDSEFSGNSASEVGGAIFINGEALIVNSTLSGNGANDRGGAIFVGNGLTRVRNSTVTENHADTDGNATNQQSILGMGGGISSSENGAYVIHNSIVSLNRNGDDQGRIDDLAGNVNLGSANNLLGGNRGAVLDLVDRPGNVLGSPRLAPLADNGGPTRTHRPYADSLAIDAGNNAFAIDADLDPLVNDQRGLSRVLGESVDIGAYEARDDIRVTIEDATADEADRVIDFQIRLAQPLPAREVIHLQIDTRNGTADTSDYDPQVGRRFTITGGDALTRTLSIPITDDAVVEDAESFEVVLTSATGRGLVSDTPGVGTIIDNDLQSKATVMIDEVTISESIGAGTITVSVDQPLDESVTIVLSGSSDSSGVIFNTGRVEIPAGHTTGTVAFEVNNDTVVEGDQSYMVSVESTITSGNIEFDVTDTGTITVEDDDQANFIVKDLTFNEDVGVATFAVLLDNPINIPVLVNVTFADGTATALDYDNTDQVVRFAAGDTEALVSIEIIDDDLLESAESFTVNLDTITDLGDRDIDLSDMAEIAIFDNDQAIRDWHNEQNAYDVNRDGTASALDALTIINDLSQSGVRELDESSDDAVVDVDVNNDGWVTALDALSVINELTRTSVSESEALAITEDDDEQGHSWADNVDAALTLF